MSKRGLTLVRIFFKYEKEAIGIYRSLCAKRSALSYAPQCFKLVNSQLLVIDVTYNRDEIVHDMLIPVLTDFILGQKEESILSEILTQKFFYTDSQELQLIIDMVYHIVEGEKEDVPKQDFSMPKELLIREALQDFLVNNVTFTFESFLQFRLKNYRSRLQYYVEIAIDEYKLEYEYQMFVEQLRQVILTEEANCEAIHVVYSQESEFQLYDENFTLLTANQRQHLAEEFMKKNESLYIDPSVIAPLITLSPEHIYIYSDREHTHDFIYTIQNLFQERVIICTKQEATFLKKENLT